MRNTTKADYSNDTEITAILKQSNLLMDIMKNKSYHSFKLQKSFNNRLERRK